MKNYVNQIIKRVEDILDTEVIQDIPQRQFQTGDVVGLISITLSNTKTNDISVIPAKSIEAFLADPKQHTPPNTNVGLACMFINICETDLPYVVGEASMSTKMLNSIPEPEREKKAKQLSPRFKTYRDKTDITWDYCEADNFIWGDMPGNEGGRFPVDPTQHLYIDVEYILMLVIGNGFLFSRLANVIVNYFTYYLEDSSEIESWGEETLQRLAKLHHRARLYSEEQPANTALH